MTKIGPFRRFDTGQAIVITIDGDKISSVEPAASSNDLPWVAPGFWDLQTNGRWGISFASLELTPLDVERVVLENARSGVTQVFPTLITAPSRTFLHGLEAIATACDRWPLVDAMVGGVHLEGPWISEREGYRGAHPPDSICDPDFTEFERFQEASGGRIAIVTLAPERPGAIEFIGRIVELGVTVAIGHTSADRDTLGRAIEAGAKLSTHLGNGIASPLPRHPNPIFDQAADDRLMASLIADGEHLDPRALRVLARAKGPENVILVSDLSPLAGASPGVYGGWEVAIHKIVVAGTNYLAGSVIELPEAAGRLICATGWTLAEAIATITANPARLLQRKNPEISGGQPADLVVFDLGTETAIRPILTMIAGQILEDRPSQNPADLERI